MKYEDGSEVMLGDIVSVSVPNGEEIARVVMMGDCYKHLEIDAQFLEWVKAEKILAKSSVVVEWVNENPFEHTDPQYAPVGNLMFTSLDDVTLKMRAPL